MGTVSGICVCVWQVCVEGGKVSKCCGAGGLRGRRFEAALGAAGEPSYVLLPAIPTQRHLPLQMGKKIGGTLQECWGAGFIRVCPFLQTPGVLHILRS